MAGRLIDQDLVTVESIVDPYSEAGKRINSFLAARAQTLAGRYINFTETPVTFVLSDKDEPNAFFAPVFDPKNIPRRADHETVVFTRNPFPTPVICVSRGLIDLADNLDALDFVLGHELTHMMMRHNGIKYNSKGEEEMADLHAVDLVYDAGGDPKQAMLITEKIHAYARNKIQAAKEKDKETRGSQRDSGIDWSEIFDVHMTDNNRKSGISASLTRLSHLIDGRIPTPLDRDVFDVRYTDPIDAFLDAHDYHIQSPDEQIKILINCVDHLAVPGTPANDYFQAILNASCNYERGEPEFYIEQERKTSLQERLDNDEAQYFCGPVIDKKYQQKLARLTEETLPHIKNPETLFELNIYLQDQAYTHIQAHGYPTAQDSNYLDAASILYSYFYHVIASTMVGDETCQQLITQAYPAQPHMQSYRAYVNSLSGKSVLESNIREKNETIKAATTVDVFLKASEELDYLHRVTHFIQFAGDSFSDTNDKLENLSAFRGDTIGYLRSKTILYDNPISLPLPWENLIAIAQENTAAKAGVIELLHKNSITDFRLSHDVPYVRLENGYYYTFSEHDRQLKEVPEYEVDFATHNDVVLKAYDYIRSYFNNEESLIRSQCDEVLRISLNDFYPNTRENSISRDRPLAAERIYDLIFLFNTLPNAQADSYKYIENAASLIPSHYHTTQPMPGRETDHLGRASYSFSSKLLHFGNPIFQDHFGLECRDELLLAKNTARDQVFDTVLHILDKVTDTFLLLQTQKEIVGRTVDFTSDALRSQRLLHNAYDASETLLYNILFGVFSDRNKWSLQTLNQEQKNTLAQYVVNDKNGIFLSLFGHERYEYFCTHLRVLELQCLQILEGDYQLTEAMQHIADHHGYQHANSENELSAFVNNAHSPHKHKSDTAKYVWYLHIFDTMRYLEQTPKINIYDLAIAITQIEQPESNVNSGPHEIVEAARASYEHFVQNSRLLPVVERAINHNENYQGLSFDRLVQTADALITMRNSINKTASDKKPFLNTVDATITKLLKQAEQAALGHTDALDKCAQLYNLYHPPASYYDRDKSRSSYLKSMIQTEQSLEKLSSLSEAQGFWPDDALEHIKAFLYAKKTFLDGKEADDFLLSKVEALPPGKKKNQCLFMLLDKQVRGLYPETRERVFKIFVDNVLTQLGQDDGSDKYRNRLAVYVKAINTVEDDSGFPDQKKITKAEDLLSGVMAPADKYTLLRRLSDAILSQEQTSQLMKDASQIKLNSTAMVKSYFYGIGVDYLTQEMDRDPIMAKRIISFLNSKGGKSDCDRISAYFKDRIESKQKISAHIIKHTQPENCKILYENFWGTPLEARAVIISRMLKSASSTQEDSEQGDTQSSWEDVFHLAMDTLIPSADQSIEALYARDIMHSYIKARSDYERELIMSAMMVANRNIGNDQGNIGKALKLFLENMGPAEIKLGQAIASHPNTPPSIKVELQALKNAADIPARWTLYEWIRAENIPHILWKNEHLGAVLGSASYYTTIALGKDKVLRVLRHEAREKAEKGFRVIGHTIRDLQDKSASSSLKYDELTASVQEMVLQAAQMSNIETDHVLGHRQLEYAKSLYSDVELQSGNTSFSLQVMDWQAMGKNWIVMDRAQGLTFNALPTDTAEQKRYKRDFAKAYITLEIRNILSGQRFDHDRHGAQLSINPQTHTVGIYDTGAMALSEPTPQDQQHLGHVMYVVIKAAVDGQDPFTTFTNSITDRIATLHRTSQNTTYLIEVKKSLLALGDFFAGLEPKDIADILPGLDFSKDLSPHVQSGLTGMMTIHEKAQYNAYKAVQGIRHKNGVRISRKKKAVVAFAPIPTDAAHANSPLKSSWFKNAFATEQDLGGSAPHSPPAHRNRDSYLQAHIA